MSNDLQESQDPTIKSSDKLIEQLENEIDSRRDILHDLNIFTVDVMVSGTNKASKEKVKVIELYRNAMVSYFNELSFIYSNYDDGKE